MDTELLRIFAEAKLREHHLDEKGWVFRYDGALRRFGCCKHGQKLITVSKALVEINSEDECRNVVLHEIGHALAGYLAGHGLKWKQITTQIGGSADIHYDTNKVQAVPYRWIATCPSCGRELFRYKKSELSCGRCAPKFDLNYLYTWKRSG